MKPKMFDAAPVMPEPSVESPLPSADVKPLQQPPPPPPFLSSARTRPRAWPPRSPSGCTWTTVPVCGAATTLLFPMYSLTWPGPEDPNSLKTMSASWIWLNAGCLTAGHWLYVVLGTLMPAVPYAYCTRPEQSNERPGLSDPHTY